MIETIEANRLVFGAVLILALLVAWWLLRRASKPAPRAHKPDVLDEGVGPARRNQTLIDAAPVAQIVTPPPVSGAMAGVGEVVAVAAQDAVEEAEVRVQKAASPFLKPARTEPVEGNPPLPPEVVPALDREPEPEEIPAPKPEPAPQPVPEIERAPEPEPEPSPEFEQAPPPEPEPAPPIALAPDDLARIKGLGPKLQALLPTLGVTSFAQIAAWTDEELARIDSQLGPFAGRPARDGWVEQAKYLAVGDVTGFEDRFGKV